MVKKKRKSISRFSKVIVLSVLALIITITLGYYLIDNTTENNSGINSNGKLLPVIVQLDPSCDYSELFVNDVEVIAKGENFTLIKTEETFINILKLEHDACVIRSFQPKELETVLSELQGDFDNERDEKFKELKLNRSIENQDVTDLENLKEYLQNKREAESAELTGGIISEYQLYVTPEADAVVELADEIGSDIQDIYDESLSWIWVSEEYLNGVAEYWYYPEEFLTETPSLRTNPSPGDLASDCSEQANTLVSLLIASGVSAENVRVVLGLVDFDGSVGGHAWAEIYEDGRWYALEATAGAYYDEGSNTLTEAGHIPYTYFKYHSYPSEEIWYYYNNEFFMEPRGVSNAPEHWNEGSRSFLRDDLESFAGGSRGVNGAESNPLGRV